MDRFDLSRFTSAQSQSIECFYSELRAGRKATHWMWYVFPQVAGLGSSYNATYYSIGSCEEATSYLSHETLGPRLIECSNIVASHLDTAIESIFGEIDALKFHASVTLFREISNATPVFQKNLDLFFEGRSHEQTLKIISSWQSAEPVPDGNG